MSKSEITKYFLINPDEKLYDYIVKGKKVVKKYLD